jgi:hypothetical protein
MKGKLETAQTRVARNKIQYEKKEAKSRNGYKI